MGTCSTDKWHWSPVPRAASVGDRARTGSPWRHRDRYGNDRPKARQQFLRLCWLRAARVRASLLEVRDAEQIDALISHIEKTYGPLSVLVNNAGITRDNLSMRLKDDEWESVLDTNLKAVFRLCRAVMRGMMKARYGRIINVTSVVGHAGNPGQANYCAAKAGVAGMSRALARELGSRNITVNCVAPGLIDTDMTRALDDKQKAALLAGVPLGRFGSPQEVAAAVAFLASAGAAYVTGTTIHVNGGMFMG
jgi:3-oxoacyl-[acyl-carrier protein] reductase